MISFEYFPNRKLCRIFGDKFDEIRECFSVKNENAFFMRRMGRGFVPSRIYCITPTGLFEPGLFYDILTYVKNVYPNEEIKTDDKIQDVVKPGMKGASLYTRLNLELRDYQQDIINQSFLFGRGIIKLGTGGGKTLTIASLLSSFFESKNKKMKCLLVVPDLTLVSQTHKDFIDYGVPFKTTKWTGSVEPDFTANVIIANMGVLQSRFEEEDWLKDVDILVVDECHKLKKGNKICKIISSIKTFHKFGLTGSLPDNKIDEWNIVGKLGNVFYEKSSYELRTESYLTNAEIKIVKIKYQNKVPNIVGANKFRTELDFIYSNRYRNEVIKIISDKCKNNILILVNHIVHGDILLDYLKSNLPDRKVYFIRGEVEVGERARVVKEMEDNDNVVCIAISAIFSTGVNIKNLHMIIFASGGKSFVRTIQSIGRGLRLNPNKDKLTIIDLADDLKYSSLHSQRRQEIYTEEKIQYKIGEIVEKL
jgi:superfamily II DNA or RNA helicase